MPDVGLAVAALTDTSPTTTLDAATAPSADTNPSAESRPDYNVSGREKVQQVMMSSLLAVRMTSAFHRADERALGEVALDERVHHQDGYDSDDEYRHLQ